MKMNNRAALMLARMRISRPWWLRVSVPLASLPPAGNKLVRLFFYPFHPPSLLLLRSYYFAQQCPWTMTGQHWQFDKSIRFGSTHLKSELLIKVELKKF